MYLNIGRRSFGDMNFHLLFRLVFDINVGICKFIFCIADDSQQVVLISCEGDKRSAKKNRVSITNHLVDSDCY